MTDWTSKGCQHCRAGVLSGRSDVPQEVATNIEAHAHLRHCPFCGSWWEVGEREAHVISENVAKLAFADYFGRLGQPPVSLSAGILSAVAAAMEAGGSVETVAQWSRALVVHMKEPLPEATRAKLQREFADLRFFRHDQDPHYAPSEGFMDERSATGISFPFRAGG
jgi:hypothetical protein